MTELEARTIYERFCADRNRKPMPGTARYQPDGSWRFVEIEEQGYNGAYEGVVVRATGEAFPFGGALGKVFRNFPDLGAPKSDERALGATAFGHYQAFDAGVAIWEGKEDLSFPVLESMSPLHRQLCIVAFFDLRGFTSWSRNAASDHVQQAIHALEDAVHVGFPTTLISLPRLFLKGTGDGVMVVSQADWHVNATLGQSMNELAPGHALDFLHACERIVSAGRARITQNAFPLAIGCGIASGELDRVILFGRFDFIGPAANEAAKLQQHAWNEICVTRSFGAILEKCGRIMDADWKLAVNGWRLRSRDQMSDAQPSAAAYALQSARR